MYTTNNNDAGYNVSVLSKVFLAIIESKFVTFELQNLAKLRGTTVKNGDFTLLLGLQFLENFVPIRPSGIGARL